ncbi:MAG: hypothetical protein ACLP4V_16205 [Methylocella sp.]
MSGVFWTVFSGTVIYVLGQLALKLVIEPIHDLKKTIGVISYSLIERANVIYNPLSAISRVKCNRVFR